MPIATAKSLNSPVGGVTVGTSILRAERGKADKLMHFVLCVCVTTIQFNTTAVKTINESYKYGK